MRMLKRFAAAAVACYVLMGCGGASIGEPEVSPVYVGDWTGTWTSTSLAQNGTVSVQVAADGGVTGTTTNAITTKDGTIAGRVSGGSKFNGTHTILGSTATALKGTFSERIGGITGSMTQTITGVDHDVTFDLAPAP